METENKMITLTTILTCVLFALFVMTATDIMSRVWNGYPVTVEDITTHMFLLAVICGLIYIIK